MAEKLETSHTTIQTHLERLGKVHKFGIWVPHRLSEQNLAQRVTIASSLLSRNTREPFLDRIVTGDEKWVLYVNVKRRKQWLSRGQTPLPTAKLGLHPKKIMLCIWWDVRGVVHWELLDPNQTVTAEVYCTQLDRLNENLKRNRLSLANRKGVALRHDNARWHNARLTQTKINELGWEVLPHPPYSPDVAPSDYRLFWSLQNFLVGKEFADEEDVNRAITSFIASKPPSFFRDGIEKLVTKWRQVIDNEGQYIID